FHHSVPEGEKVGREDQGMQAIGKDAERDTKHVTDEGHVSDAAGTQRIIEWASTKSCNRKTENAHEVDPSELGVGKAHVGHQVIHDAGPNSKCKGGSEECETTGDKQPVGIDSFFHEV